MSVWLQRWGNGDVSKGATPDTVARRQAATDRRRRAPGNPGTRKVSPAHPDDGALVTSR